MCTLGILCPSLCSPLRCSKPTLAVHNPSLSCHRNNAPFTIRICPSPQSPHGDTASRTFPPLFGPLARHFVTVGRDPEVHPVAESAVVSSLSSSCHPSRAHHLPLAGRRYPPSPPHSFTRWSIVCSLSHSSSTLDTSPPKVGLAHVSPYTFDFWSHAY